LAGQRAAALRIGANGYAVVVLAIAVGEAVAAAGLVVEADPGAIADTLLDAIAGHAGHFAPSDRVGASGVRPRRGDDGRRADVHRRHGRERTTLVIAVAGPHPILPGAGTATGGRVLAATALADADPASAASPFLQTIGHRTLDRGPLDDVGAGDARRRCGDAWPCQYDPAGRQRVRGFAARIQASAHPVLVVAGRLAGERLAGA